MHSKLLAAAITAVLSLIVITGVGLAAQGTATVKTRHGSIGTFLVDGRGHTLYLFAKDKPRRSSCAGACATNWPPLLTSGKPKASGSVRKALLGTIKRADGRTQVTYAGHPLYRFSGDAKPGDTNGQRLQAFGARWYAVNAGGRRVGGGY